ncbi:MAG: hypothetical protein Q4P36_05480 [Bowdeniella nasicola]|nr:hypothetical protein [Bowdeniella nasicola]
MAQETVAAMQARQIPNGVELATFESYLSAQKAVDTLSDAEFPVQATSIIGTDLVSVERVLGRLTLTRASMAGAGTGAWLGLMYGLLMWIVVSEGAGMALISGLLLGIVMGAIFGAVSYLFTRGKRDFTSSSQVVARHYAVLCAPEYAGKARTILREAGIAGVAPERRPRPAEPEGPPAYGIRLDEDGNPIEH